MNQMFTLIAYDLRSQLRERGTIALVLVALALAVRPPTVPVGTARVRFSLTLAHGDDDLAFAAAQVVQALRAEGVV